MLLHSYLRRLATLLALLLCAHVHAAPVAAPTPIERFFINPALRGAELSPSGRYLAAISGAAGRRDFLVVIDLQANSAKLVAGYNDADIFQFTWVNDGRLLFNVTDNEVGPGGHLMAAGLYAVDRDGGKLRQLAQRRGQEFVTEGGSHLKSRILPWHTFMMDARGAQDSDSVYVES